MVPFFDNSADIIWKVLARDCLVRIGIHPNDSSKKNETDCNASDKCLFPHHKVDEQPNQKAEERLLFTKKKRKRRQECCGYCEKCITNGFASRKTRMHWFLKVENSLRGNPMQKVLGPIRRKQFTQSALRQASIREKKGPSLGKIQVKNPHQRSPHGMKFEDQSHEETERQQRCARSNARNLAKNITISMKKTASFYSPAEEWVLPVAETQEPEEKEFVVDSGASMHMLSKKDLNSGELETMRTSRSPTTVMSANGEVQTREEATVYVKEFGRIRDSHGSWRNTRSFFFRETLRGSWVYLPRTSGPKPHLTKKCQENQLQYSEVRTIRGLWFINEFLCNTHIYIFSIFITGFCIWRQTIHRKHSTWKKWKYEGCCYGETRCIDQQKTENKNKNEGREEIQRDLLHDLPDWLQEFRVNLVDKSNPLEPRRNPAPKD